DLHVEAQPSQGSVENLKLVGAGKAEVGFSMVDAAWQAVNGIDQFRYRQVNAKTLMVLYPNRMQIVTREGAGIRRLADLKGKRVSTGASGSGVEVMALRVLDAIGIAPDKDVVREQLGLLESVAAIKERRIDAFFWVGGVPSAAIADLAATPGVKVRLLDHADALDALNRKHGPLYAKGIIPQNSYPGMDRPVTNIDVWNILVTSDRMSDQMAYDIAKTLMEKKPELVALHPEAQNIDIRYQRIGSPVPYHPGAKKYLEEHGVRF
ncbi:MAG: TAXI family TRAP transporter solute-binding subunit, partial [Betaproteobacteria bacterium]